MATDFKFSDDQHLKFIWHTVKKVKLSLNLTACGHEREEPINFSFTNKHHT